MNMYQTKSYVPGTSPEEEDPPVMDFCTVCGEELRADYTFFEDGEGNRFCSTDCALKHYEVKEEEWNYE